MRKSVAVWICTAMWAAPAQSADSLRAWLQALAFRQLEARQAEVQHIATAAEVQARGRRVRETLLRLMGGLPAERTPLNVRKTGVIDRGDYRVEKLIYESQPKFYVTANLYVPQTGRGPYPAVLHPTGHSVQAKARAFYQTLSLGLVKSGFVVLTYDPLGQGERRIFFDADLGDSKVGGTTVEHMMVGLQNLLAGESMARLMVWDGMRGIDVLASRPEVDAKRIGVTGCSGGGTLTAYLAALDPRLEAAAPACYISAWEEQLPGTGPQDAEQQFPDHLKEGLDHADFATAFAPRPYLIVSTEEDFFPLAGARRSYEESRRLYGLFGAQEKIAWAVGPGGHGMPQNVREAVYGWMTRWLKGGAAGPVAEPAFRSEYEEALYCTPTGQVSTSLGGETASTLTMRRYADKRSPRPALDRLRTDIARLTRFQAPNGTAEAAVGAAERRSGYTLTRLTLAAPGGRTIPALLARPDNPRGKTVLVAGEEGAAAAMREGADGDALARQGRTVLALDAAGFGETLSSWEGYSDAWFGPDKLAWLGMMTGRPLPGLAVTDALCALDYLEQQRLAPGGCAGYGRGMAGTALLYAAALDKRLAEVTLEGGLISWEAVVRTPVHRRIMAGLVPGVLGVYDLPDLAAAVAPRPLALVSLRMPGGNTALLKDVREAYAYAAAVYKSAGAAERLTITLRREGEPVEAFLPAL
jgi:dienelactone hydrolase